MGEQKLESKLNSIGIGYVLEKAGCKLERPGYSNTRIADYSPDLNNVMGYRGSKNTTWLYGASEHKNSFSYADGISKKLRLYPKKCNECGRVVPDYQVN